jgi:hypothetical protein
MPSSGLAPVGGKGVDVSALSVEASGAVDVPSAPPQATRTKAKIVSKTPIDGNRIFFTSPIIYYTTT